MKYSTIGSVHLLALGVMLATGGIVTAQSLNSSRDEGEKGCSNRTLLGDYGAKFEGTHLGLSVRTLALFRFDGEGGITVSAYPIVNGTPPPNNQWTESTGTYTINSNCSGSVAVVFPPIQFHVVVVDRGRQFYLVTDDGGLTGEARKVHGKSGEHRHDDGDGAAGERP